LLLFFFSTPLILRHSTKTQQSSITACRLQILAANLASLQQLLIHRNKSSQNSQKFRKKKSRRSSTILHTPTKQEQEQQEQEEEAEGEEQEQETKTKQVNTKTMAKT
jgi:hypothetical protein